MLDHSCQVQRHALSERKDDLYETPVVAVEALLRVETLPHRLWDPACGPGNIVDVLRALFAAYPSLHRRRIVGHCDIAPGRKTDPGPSFDWPRLYRDLGER